LGGKNQKKKAHASNRGKMSVKRALKDLKEFLKSHNGRIALKCSHPPVTTSGNYSYDHGQSPKFTNQVGNKITTKLLKARSQCKCPVPMLYKLVV